MGVTFDPPWDGDRQSDAGTGTSDELRGVLVEAGTPTRSESLWFRDESQRASMTKPEHEARFGPGEVVIHSRFGYRGVIVDVGPVFGGTDEWYDQVARSRPPGDRPWYHVLVHGAEHTTYVAERHLEREPEPGPIEHPLLEHFFDDFRDGRYGQDRQLN